MKAAATVNSPPVKMYLKELIEEKGYTKAQATRYLLAQGVRADTGVDSLPELVEVEK